MVNILLMVGDLQGTIEHSEVGNILRIIDSELEPLVPSKYKKRKN